MTGCPCDLARTCSLGGDRSIAAKWVLNPLSCLSTFLPMTNINTPEDWCKWHSVENHGREETVFGVWGFAWLWSKPPFLRCQRDGICCAKENVKVRKLNERNAADIKYSNSFDQSLHFYDASVTAFAKHKKMLWRENRTEEMQRTANSVLV